VTIDATYLKAHRTATGMAAKKGGTPPKPPTRTVPPVCRPVRGVIAGEILVQEIPERLLGIHKLAWTRKHRIASGTRRAASIHRTGNRQRALRRGQIDCAPGSSRSMALWRSSVEKQDMSMPWRTQYRQHM